jgi:hypothetical protein
VRPSLTLRVMKNLGNRRFASFYGWKSQLQDRQTMLGSSYQSLIRCSLRSSSLFRTLSRDLHNRGCGSLDFGARIPSPPGPLSPQRGEGEMGSCTLSICGREKPKRAGGLSRIKKIFRIFLTFQGGGKNFGVGFDEHG